MQLPDALVKHLHEQLADQAGSDDAQVARGSALGWGALGRRQQRDAELRSSLELPAPDSSGIEGAREEH